MIKIFADTANLNEMIALHDEGSVEGFTTNPTLMRKAGVTDYETFARAAIEAVPDLPVSFEVLSDDSADIIREARVISSWGSNVYVKVPIINLAGEVNLEAIGILLRQEIPLNITAIVNPRLVHKIVPLLNQTPTIVSVFAGRIADTGRNAQAEMAKVRSLIESRAQLLWASTRQVYSIVEAKTCGCDIITVTPDVLRKYQLWWRHNLQTLTLYTVQQFYDDARAAKYTIGEAQDTKESLRHMEAKTK